MADSTLRVQSGGGSFGTATLRVAEGFSNHGLIELTSVNSSWTAALEVTNGTLVNTDGATIHTQVATGGRRVLTAELDNRGTLWVDYGTTINKDSANHINSGEIKILGGDLKIEQAGETSSLSSSGTITVAAEGQFRVNDGKFEQIGGTRKANGMTTIA